MCGIVGMWQRAGGIDPTTLVAATDSIRHRGPDDEGYLLIRSGGDLADGMVACRGRETAEPDGLVPVSEVRRGEHDLAFGFRRLSIVDLTRDGHQPMVAPDGQTAIVFNGEIYNHVELRSELEAIGVRFRSRSDTEVALHAFRTWGTDCFARFTGMFAIAVWDGWNRRLVLARDHFGIKPLLYSMRGDRFAFGSELKALLEIPWVGRQADPQQVHHFLVTGRAGQDAGSMIAGVKQLPAAHWMSIEASGDELVMRDRRRYWSFDLTRRERMGGQAAAQRVREAFDESVRLHLRSDVTVAAALSGGIDSSSIVMSMRQLVGADQPIRTFSFISDQEETSEERWIRIVADAAGVEPTTVKPSSRELVDDLDDLVAAQDEPFGSTTIYAQYRVFKLAREHGIKVMLDGQGADEYLAGYRGYVPARLATLLRRRRWRDYARTLRGAAALPGHAGIPELIRASMDLAMRQTARRRPVVAGGGAAWLGSEWFASHEVMTALPFHARGGDVLRESLVDTIQRTSLPELLRYADRNSMAHSIESRVPFLEPKLVELVLALPEERVLPSHATTKWVFREAMRPVVPAPILDRRDKIGFDTPEQAWLESMRGWVEETLNGPEIERIPALRARPLREMWAGVLHGHRPYSKTIWRAVNLVRWAERLGVTFDAANPACTVEVTPMAAVAAS